MVPWARRSSCSEIACLELHFGDHEQDLYAVVNDRDERPPPPLESSARVSAVGLGEFWKHEFPTDEDVAREATADWLMGASSLASDLAGQGDSASSYVRSLGCTLLLTDVADPRASDLTPDATWQLVRDRAMVLAATSTDAAVQTWALSFSEVDVVAGAVKGTGTLVVTPPMSPGDVGVSTVMGVA